MDNWITRVLSDRDKSPSSKRFAAFIALVNFLVFINAEVFGGIPVSRDLLTYLLIVIGAGLFGSAFEHFGKPKDKPNG